MKLSNGEDELKLILKNSGSMFKVCNEPTLTQVESTFKLPKPPLSSALVEYCKNTARIKSQLTCIIQPRMGGECRTGALHLSLVIAHKFSTSLLPRYANDNAFSQPLTFLYNEAGTKKTEFRIGLRAWPSMEMAKKDPEIPKWL